MTKNNIPLSEEKEQQDQIKSEQAKQPTLEEMKALLQGEKQVREKRAVERIALVLKEELCVMNPVVTLTAQGIRAIVEITAVD